MNKTNRGFDVTSFNDYYGSGCSLQKSSLAEHDAIWFGVDEPDLVIFEDENMGRYVKTKLPKNWSAHSRMHLTREQVKELLPYLQHFVETGDLDYED